MRTPQEMRAIEAAVKEHLIMGARVRLTLAKGVERDLEVKWLTQPCSSVGWTELGFGPEGEQSSQSIVLYWNHLVLQGKEFLVESPPGAKPRIFFQRLPVEKIEILS